MHKRDALSYLREAKKKGIKNVKIVKERPQYCLRFGKEVYCGSMAVANAIQRKKR